MNDVVIFKFRLKCRFDCKIGTEKYLVETPLSVRKENHFPMLQWLTIGVSAPLSLVAFQS